MMWIQRLLFLSLVFVRMDATSSSESQSHRLSQQPINFYGVVKTRQGNEYRIENITVNGKFRDIMLYEKPQKEEKNGEGQFILASDPQKILLKVLINLADISRIDIPEKPIMWIYQKKASDRKMQYLEIEITKKGSTSTQLYLMPIEYDDQLAFYTILTDGKPQKMTLPLLGLSSLTIGGYCTQEAGAPSCATYGKKNESVRKGILQ